MRKEQAAFAAAFVLAALALPGCLSRNTDDPTGVVTGLSLPPEAIYSCAISCEWSGLGSNCPPGSVPIPWAQIAFLGILVILLFLSIAYMAAVVFRRVDWLIFVKEEFYQALLSALLIVAVSWFAVAACEVSWAVAGQDPFTAADIYLNNLIWQKTIDYATNLKLNSIYLQVSAALFIPMGSPPSGLKPLAGLDSVAGVYDFLYGLVSMLFASLLMQTIMLKFIQSFMFKIVLPLGIFFRVFPFLRQAGATFIAIALAFYIVMPMMYVMNKAVVEQLEGKLMTAPGHQIKKGVDKLGYMGILGKVDYGGVVGNVAKLIPQAVFLPALNTVIVYAFMKSAAKMLAQRFPSPFE